MKYLESIGIDIYSINNLGNNAYIVAASNGHIKTLKFLESRGFNIYLKNKKKENAYKYALCNNNLPLIKYLAKRGFKNNLKYICEHTNIKIVKYIRRQIKLRLNRMRIVFIFVPQNSLGPQSNN